MGTIVRIAIFIGMLGAFGLPEAQGAKVDPADAPFLPSDRIDLAALLPAPPARDSAETSAEIVEIHSAQSVATASEKAQAVADAEENALLFQQVLGPNFTSGNLPTASKFFEAVGKTEGEFVDSAKQVFARPRPPLVDLSIMPCRPLGHSAAYPSGHATFGWLEAIVLAQMLPEKRELIFRRAGQYAEHRILCGVHYRSDIEAGKISAFVIAAALLKEPVFQQEFAPAKIEVRQALGLPAN
jgi:acid phosphatase (class A)